MTRASPQTDRVVALLGLLAGDHDGASPAATPAARALTLAEVSRALGVHKATCHSMLAALTTAGWLRKDPVRKTYQLGPELVRIGDAAASRVPALDFARSAMADLASGARGHCIAFLPEGDHLTVVSQVRAPGGGGHPMPVGTEFPLHPPYGAAAVCWAPGGQREAWLAEAPADVRPRYRRALARTAKRGYAIGLHVFPDVRLQNLASLMRRTEAGGQPRGRVGALAGQLTDELMRRPEWFVTSLRPAATYQVSHVDAPIFADDGRVALMLSVVPVDAAMTGAQVGELGARVVEATGAVSAALAGSAAP